MFFVLQLLHGIEWLRLGDKVQGDYNFAIIMTKKVFHQFNLKRYFILSEDFKIRSAFKFCNYFIVVDKGKDKKCFFNKILIQNPQSSL